MFERFFENHDVRDLAFSFFLRGLALSVVMVFGAIFLYDLGAPLPLIFGYFLAMYGLDFLLSVPSSWIASRVGFKHLILFAQVPTIAQVIWLSQLQTAGPHVLLIGALGGVALSTYWTAHHGIMAARSDEDHRTGESALLDVMSKLAGVIGPIVGGFAIAAFGFTAVFGAASVLLAASALLLLRTPEVRAEEPVSVQHLTDGIRTRDFLASLGLGFDVGANALVWPLLLYVSLLGAAGVGLASGFAFAAGVVASLLVTAFGDGRERLMLVSASIVSIVSWVLRGLLQRPLLFISEPLYGASKPLMIAPFLGRLYEDSQGHQLRTVAIRRMGINAGRITIICLPILTGLLWPSLVVAAIGSLLPMLVMTK